jgi:hypothetical protein
MSNPPLFFIAYPARNFAQTIEETDPARKAAVWLQCSEITPARFSICQTIIGNAIPMG